MCVSVDDDARVMTTKPYPGGGFTLLEGMRWTTLDVGGASWSVTHGLATDVVVGRHAGVTLVRWV
jgi:hypothetical protein